MSLVVFARKRARLRNARFRGAFLPLWEHSEDARGASASSRGLPER